MKFLALIPARYASTRFPGKPLADLGGKPMIRHVYEKARAFFDTCYVATDDERIERAVAGFGGRAIMTSTDHRSGTDRCREALDKAEALCGERFDIVVNIQADEPFVPRPHGQKSARHDPALSDGVRIAVVPLCAEPFWVLHLVQERTSVDKTFAAIEKFLFQPLYRTLMSYGWLNQTYLFHFTIHTGGYPMPSSG